MVVRWRILVGAAGVIISVGCTGNHTANRAHPTSTTTVVASVAGPTIAASATSTTAAPTTPTVASLTCTASGNPVVLHALFQVQGQATGGSLWALVFHDHPFPAGSDVKIAWHMTGAGPFQLTASNLASGQSVTPVSGPVVHTSSSWHRPGEEWGSGWIFPSPGCWEITAARPDATGFITVMVADARSSELAPQSGANE